VDSLGPQILNSREVIDIPLHPHRDRDLDDTQGRQHKSVRLLPHGQHHSSGSRHRQRVQQSSRPHRCSEDDGANNGHVPCTTEEQNYRATEVILAHSENSVNALDPPLVARAINTALKKYKFLCGNKQVLGRSALYDIAELELLEKAQVGATETELESVALRSLLALRQTG